MVTRIDRAAWKRIKERVANPGSNTDRATNLASSIRSMNGISERHSATFFKGRSVVPTMGVLEQMTEQFDVAEQRLDETAEEFRARCARRWNTLVRDTEGEAV